MCNNYVNDIAYDAYREAFAALRIPVRFPDAAPNLAPQHEVRPTDAAPIIRGEEGGGKFMRLPWGLPASRRKGPPVINFRAEGRRFEHGRCLVPASFFHEYTGTRYPKTKWRFARADGAWMAIAGLWRPVGEDGAAFTMLTVEPGPDVLPIHDRQVVVLERSDWAAWLDPATRAEHLLKPSPAGTFAVEEVSPGRDQVPTLL